MTKEKTTRFEIVTTEGNGLTSPVRKILRDTTTGVQYLFVQDGYAGGLTPLLDMEGRPLLWRG